MGLRLVRYTKEAIVRYLQILGPAYPTVCMDTFFTNRPQQPTPLIGSDIVKQFIKTIALSRRGAPAISIGGNTGQTQFYEPLPIKPKIGVNGVDLNNLRMFMQQANSKSLLETWAQTKTDILRKTVRATTEAICARALTGKIVYPVALEGGGYDTFSIDYGAPQALDAGSFKLLDDPTIKISDIQKMLVKIRKVFQRSGISGEIVYWAGEDVYNALFDLVSRVLTSSKLIMEAGVKLETNEEFVMIGQTKIWLRCEEYIDPQTGAFTSIIPANTLKAVAKDAGHQMPYAALDDLDSNLEPMPLFIKPIRLLDGSGYDLQAESKPLPVVNSLGICDVVLLGAAPPAD